MRKALRLLFTVTCLIPLLLSAQQNDNTILTQFQHYRKQSFTEKVYIHSDRNNYLPGQVLWWKLYYVDGYFNKPANLSKVVYVEMLDADNKPVLQAKAALSEDGSDGSFYLPLSLGSGNYTLRAYTNWMKNFGAEYFFSKQITIVNPLKAARSQSVEMPAFDAGFFPEGGNLVRGLESRVGFRVTDQYGKGQDFKGVIVNENRDTVLRFSPLRHGIGSFVFTPAATHTHQAVIILGNGQSILRNLPAIAESGYVMRLLNSGNGPLTITVTSTRDAADKVFLFAHTRQIIKLDTSATLTNGKAVISVDRSLFGDGISQLTLFDQDHQPVCERLYFNYPRHSLSIGSGTNSQYGLRKKVNLSVQTKLDANGHSANLSVAVYRVDSLERERDDNIESYLWLGSDLKGTVESPASYFTSQDAETRLAMDNLMLTHGWRRFAWTAPVKDSLKIVYQPEFDGHIITGRLTNGGAERPEPDVNVFLSIPGTLVQFYPAKSDSAGYLHFDARGYYGPGEIVLQPDSTVTGNHRIDITSPFSVAYSESMKLPPLVLHPKDSTDLARSSIGMQVQNIYAADSINKYAVPDLDSLPFYGNHGKVYKLDEYTRFTTMEEVLREFVLEVGIRLRNGKPHLMILDVVNKGFLSQEPVILLDGVPVSHSTILAFDPLKVYKLQVVPARYVIGDLAYDGIVSFSTHRRTLEDLPISAKSTVLEYEGLQLRREFFSPVYNTEAEIANRLPDYRQLLYWAPNVKTSAAGTASLEFFIGDVSGKYRVVIEGMDTGGNAGTGSFSFEVVKQ